jgi:flagellar motor switch protein FliN/FliY
VSDETALEGSEGRAGEEPPDPHGASGAETVAEVPGGGGGQAAQAPTSRASAPTHQGPLLRPLEALHAVELEVTAELGRTRMLLRDLLGVQVGSLVELDRPAGSPVDLLVNGVIVARGEVVVVDDEFAVRVTDLIEDGAVA